jgi:hypothetical protein
VYWRYCNAQNPSELPVRLVNAQDCLIKPGKTDCSYFKSTTRLIQQGISDCSYFIVYVDQYSKTFLTPPVQQGIPDCTMVRFRTPRRQYSRVLLTAPWLDSGRRQYSRVFLTAPWLETGRRQYSRVLLNAPWLVTDTAPSRGGGKLFISVRVQVVDRRGKWEWRLGRLLICL